MNKINGYTEEEARDLVEYIKEEYGVEVSIIDSVDKMEKQVKAKMQEDNRQGYCAINKYDIDMYS